MKLRVLGCSGGIARGLRTTSFLLDEDILIDAGSGVGDLTVSEMSAIRHVFVTHSHLDHVAFIPLLLDSIFDRISAPVTVHAQAVTLQALQDHIFNWVIWPDFSKLPQPENAVLRFEVMSPGSTKVIGGRKIEMIAVNHSVPGVGYYVSHQRKAFAFSGDTTTNDSFWEALNAHQHLDFLIVETAFPNTQHVLAQVSRHYCPGLLSLDLAKLRHQPKIYLTHLKPSEEATILAEVQASCAEIDFAILKGGEIFQL